MHFAAVAEGQLKVIGYASRAFSNAETRYCTTRKELGAIMFGLKYYRHFLLGARFVLRTDHTDLSHLKRTPHPVAQSARYLNTLAEYDYELQYRPGDLHQNADALSRRPCHRNASSPLCVKCGPILDPVDELEEDKLERGAETKVKEIDDELGIMGSMLRADAPAFVARSRCEQMNRGAEAISGESAQELTKESCELRARKARTRSSENKTQTVKEKDEKRSEGSEIIKIENLREEQSSDVELKKIIQWLEDADKVPTASELRTHSPEVQQLWAQHPSLCMRGGILYRKFVKPDGSLQYWQIIVPKNLRIAFLDTVHSGAWNGHPGIE